MGEREREESEEKNTGAAAALWCKESCHGENLIKIFAHPPSEKLPRRLELPGTPGSLSEAKAKANARVAESDNRSSQSQSQSQVIAVFSCNSFWGYLVHVETSQTSFERLEPKTDGASSSQHDAMPLFLLLFPFWSSFQASLTIIYRLLLC